MQRAATRPSRIMLTAALGAAVAAAVVAGGRSGGDAPTLLPQPAAAGAALQEAFGHISLGFVPNRGQAPPAVRYHGYGPGAGIAFTRREAAIGLGGQRLALRFIGGEAARIDTAGVGDARVNYLLGSDPARWAAGLPTYGELVYREVWPGVDVRFRGAHGALKYEVRLQPGAHAGDVRLSYRGAERLALDGRGNLLVHTPGGVLVDERPRSYQLVGGRRVPVESSFVLRGGNAYGIAVGTYDVTRPLVIDPALVYSTFLGGSFGDRAESIAVDAQGNAYLAGQAGTGFPVTIGRPYQGGDDVFVAKLAPGGGSLVYATYLGGRSYDIPGSISIDAGGNAYVSGYTGSSDFPTTPGAFDRTLGQFQDAFAVKLDPSGGTLVYGTYVGGNGSEGFADSVIGPDGSQYVVGSTSSSDLVPVGVPSYDRTLGGPGDGFVAKLAPDGGSLAYATYLGGTKYDVVTAVAVGAAGAAHVVGSSSSTDFPTTEGAFDREYNGSSSTCCGWGDAVVAQLSPDGTGLRYGTYLGGRGDEGPSNEIALGPDGDVYVATNVSSFTCCAPTRPWFSDFPTTPGAFDRTLDGFSDVAVVRLDFAATGGSGLVWSTFVGGNAADNPYGLAVDRAGNAYVSGWTVSSDFPTTAGSVSRLFSPTQFSSSEGFLTWVDASGGRLRWSSYLGGPAAGGNGDDAVYDVVLGPDETPYVAGYTASSQFPVTSRAYDRSFNGQRDAFAAAVATTPQKQIGILIADVRVRVAAGQLSSGHGEALVSTLENASREVDRGNRDPALTSLRNFVTQVNNLSRSDTFTALEAASLMRDTTEVILFVEVWNG